MLLFNSHSIDDLFYLILPQGQLQNVHLSELTSGGLARAMGSPYNIKNSSYTEEFQIIFSENFLIINFFEKLF